jgi:phosphoenolpyruvate-protein phosphotransferase (PTS system enzyme I)
LAKKSEPRRPRALRGIPTSPGIAVGVVRRVEDPLLDIEERTIPEREVELEVSRFEEAIEKARVELTELRESTRRDLDEDMARIFDVQLSILEDPMAVDRTLTAIRRERRNAAFLFRRHMLEAGEELRSRSDAFFLERGVDLVDVKQRVLRHLLGFVAPSRQKGGVLVARELTPSEAILLDPDVVSGFATEAGGATGHVAVMARARGIPAVVGVAGLMESVKEGDTIALDGLRGLVEIGPSPATVERMRRRKRAFARLEKKHARLAGAPSETLDGRRVRLAANMEVPEELDYILERGADGIGLFRTEFFFMVQHRAPSEDEQVEVYTRILDRVKPRHVVIRALDLGGDKMASYLGVPKEHNPLLGMRGIRYLVAHPRLFSTQLRAILRAGAEGKARILLPMVSSLQEFERSRALMQEAMTSLRRRRVPYDEEPLLGAMIEVPSAVMMADELAQEADFFSVGSNDLIQYLLAIDRDDGALHDLYQPHHPAVLRALRRTVEAAHRHGKPVTICGEMAGHPLSTPLLIGLGFDELSVSPYMLPDVKQAIRSVRYTDCRVLAEEALACRHPEDVTTLIRQRLGTHFSDVLELIQEDESDALTAKPAARRTAKRGTR